jgi:hypothetical protein
MANVSKGLMKRIKNIYEEFENSKVINEQKPEHFQIFTGIR